jgi:hypothetical protein
MMVGVHREKAVYFIEAGKQRWGVVLGKRSQIPSIFFKDTPQ